jgi:deazaflavin-dependent oxidoreductase (nitroreductase family)
LASRSTIVPTRLGIVRARHFAPVADRSSVGSWVVSLLSTVLRVHQMVYERSAGLIGHRLLGVPTLLLRTTGARSGLTRINALVYARDGERYLVVASNGGADRAPGWLHNLRRDPRAEIQIGRRRCRVTAAIIGRDEPDYARVWRIVNDNNAGRYDGYQKRTSRPIPVVALTPGG